jgi:hypothetical protein
MISHVYDFARFFITLITLITIFPLFPSATLYPLPASLFPLITFFLVIPHINLSLSSRISRLARSSLPSRFTR